MTAKTGGLARTKPAIFGVPSLETARAIDDSDKAAALSAAHYITAQKPGPAAATPPARARAGRPPPGSSAPR